MALHVVFMCLIYSSHLSIGKIKPFAKRWLCYHMPRLLCPALTSSLIIIVGTELWCQLWFLRITGEDEVARELHEKVRVLCWVMTGPDNHEKKAIHVKRTWGKRCNILVFMSSKEGACFNQPNVVSLDLTCRGIANNIDKSLPSVALPVKEGRQNLWGKTREAYRYVWEHYKEQADWFMKADDDTYTKKNVYSMFFCTVRVLIMCIYCWQLRCARESSLHAVSLQCIGAHCFWS